MTRETEYFLNSRSDVIFYDLIEISHPNFSKTYRMVRNAIDGLTVTLEDGSSGEFEYYPMKLTSVGQKNDLDQSIKITLGDLGEILPKEMDLIRSANAFFIKPTVKYYAYRSDELTEPLVGPYIMEVVSFNFDREGAEFEAKAPSLNVNRTGELYRIERFPMIRGFL